MTGPLLISIHDVAPSTAGAVTTWRAMLDARGLPATLLVIPGPWEGPPLLDDDALVGWLRDRVAGGDEVVQHGWTHRGTRSGPRWRRGVAAVAARGAAEFSGLDPREARRRVSWGQRVLRDLGLEPLGFTPPGWLASPATNRVLRELGFRYTSSHTAITDVQTGRRVRAVAFSHRPGGTTAPLGAAVLAAGAPRVVRAGRPLRLALHPADLANPALVSATLAAVDAALELDAAPCTYGELIAAGAPAPVG